MAVASVMEEAEALSLVAAQTRVRQSRLLSLKSRKSLQDRHHLVAQPIRLQLRWKCRHLMPVSQALMDRHKQLHSLRKLRTQLARATQLRSLPMKAVTYHAAMTIASRCSLKSEISFWTLRRSNKSSTLSTITRKMRRPQSSWQSW